MGSDGQGVRRYVRAAREEHDWSQIGLAKAARVSRGTVQNLENGLRLSEGKESRIEKALGWKLGSLDRIRNGGEPEYVNDDTDDVGVIDLNDPRDPYEEEVIASSLSRREKRETIADWRVTVAERLRVLHERTGSRPNGAAARNDANTGG
ncbi:MULTISPECIES: helix-turn-helix domain-containing protein [Prauserella salsuginis group]|uniref:Transcriptional regulator with XRE-family HTH domain n=2 Tax=Prauserella salsuginis group TaxID=2893672 RepID=A0A839Y219_9PSEU|nr:MULTISPECIES: helix-turn-helix transcriptional regulator [Prauserella salsuginis group]MBB3666386.1 transcriptional regulator with XRE-family HTH domain [Prauserella sediminis]MCR3719175.1 helix-turn-helix protein [Prauserella flava]MCR3735812.1 helix-turn-helix protein [Prauserella salsuginis]